GRVRRVGARRGCGGGCGLHLWRRWLRFLGRRHRDIRLGRGLDLLLDLRFDLLPLLLRRRGLGLLLLGAWRDILDAVALRRREGREVDDDRGRRLAEPDRIAPRQQRPDRGSMPAEHDGAAQHPTRQVEFLCRDRGHCDFSSPTSATLRKPVARSRFITSMTSPYGTVLSARRKMRACLSPLVAASSVDPSASRATVSSPSVSVRSGLTVRNSGCGGRSCGGAVEAGRSTAMSTVASGAATMKMINSTSITSMNGVTLISWTSSISALPWSRRTLIGT